MGRCNGCRRPRDRAAVRGQLAQLDQRARPATRKARWNPRHGRALALGWRRSCRRVATGLVRSGSLTGGNELLAVSLIGASRKLHAYAARHRNLDRLPAERVRAGQLDRGSEFLDGELHGNAHLVGVMPSALALGHAHVPAFIHERLPSREGIDDMAALAVHVP
jgi:hypothetical protein